MVDTLVSDEAAKLRQLEIALERRREAAAGAARAAETAAAARAANYSGRLSEPTRSESAAPGESSPTDSPVVASGSSSDYEDDVETIAQPRRQSLSENACSHPVHELECETGPSGDMRLRKRAHLVHASQRDQLPQLRQDSAPKVNFSRESPAATPRATHDMDEDAASWFVLVLTFAMTLGSMHFCVAIGCPEKAPALLILVSLLLLIGNDKLTRAAAMTLDYRAVTAVRQGLRQLVQVPSTVANTIEVDTTDGSVNVRMSEDGWAVLGMCVAGLLAVWLLKVCFSNAEVCGNGIVSSIGVVLEMLT